jgi:predicted nucleic acid-binding protein
MLVPACFENPLKEASSEFIGEVLTGDRRVAIPVSQVVGAYHVATRYLKTPRVSVKKTLVAMLSSGSPALYPLVSAEAALDALDYSVGYGVEAWDGYLVSLTRSLGSSIIYSLDRKLSKVKEIQVLSPFPSDLVEEYHEFVESVLPRK